MHKDIPICWVTYYFPPMGMAAVQRMVKIPFYLSKFGWDIKIFTPERIGYNAYDNSLIEDCPCDVKRIKYFEPLNIFSKVGIKQGTGTRKDFISFPDNKIFWLHSLKRALNSSDCDIIITSAPPFSVHISGLYQKRKGKKWIAEFRDPYSGGHLGKYFIPLYNSFAQRFESQIVHNADAIAGLTDGIIQNLKSRYNRKDGMYVITNGYDEGDFQNVKASSHSKFIFTYIGTLSRERSPLTFLEGFSTAVKRDKGFAENVEMRFIGKISGVDIKAIANALNISNFLKIKDYIPHKEVIYEMMNSDALVIITSSNPELKYVIPGKLFEYLRTGNPIIGIFPEGSGKELLSKYGKVVGEAPEKIADALLDAFYGKILPPENVSQFSWEALARKYGEVIRSVLS